jgi:hypothetical protein
MSRMNSLSASDKTLQLPDGRTLGYAEYGISDANALFYFHGHPGSRLEAMGYSTFKAGRCLLDWPDDVIELADRLGIDRFLLPDFLVEGHMRLPARIRLPTV